MARTAKTRPSILASLLEFDRRMNASGGTLVGLDEAGRGCLAGPVVAAAVVLPPLVPGTENYSLYSALNDSKKLGPAVREALAAVIIKTSSYAVCQATVEEIDSLNILRASLLAMKRARMKLPLVSHVVALVDGDRIVPDLPDRQVTVTGGDGRSASIAAASVLAKVHRDMLMRQLASRFPHYDWEKNKGYGTDSHRQAIRRYGVSPMHRRSFAL